MRYDWEQKTLGEILRLEYGKPLDASVRKSNGRYPVYGANGEMHRTDKFFHDKPSIIVGRKGSAGEVNLSEERFWPLDVTYYVIFDDQHYDLRFLYHLLKALDLPRLAKGVKPGLNRNEVYSERVAVPPLPEQRRIVAILDKAFEAIATAKANTEKNLQNARALFESHLQSVFTHHGKGWVRKRLEEVAADDCSLSYGIVQPGDDVMGGLPVARPTDLTQDTIRLDGLKRIDPKRAKSYQRTMLQGKELLLCVRGTTGVVSKAGSELAGANVTRGIVPIRFNTRFLTQDFGFHLLRAEPVQAQIRAKTYGAALMQINIGDLRQISLTFPPLAEQRVLAQKLDALAAETKRLTRLNEQKLEGLAKLKGSLLHHAFSGHL